MAHPYYQFGMTLYPAYHSNAPGMIRGTSRAAETTELGAYSIEESQGPMHFAPFADFPPLRASGPEPLDPIWSPSQRARWRDLQGNCEPCNRANLLSLAAAFGLGWFIARRK